MKRKGVRDIPDFSRKPKSSTGGAPAGNAGVGHDRPQQLKPQSKTQPKPQATSSKSGHRGK